MVLRRMLRLAIRGPQRQPNDFCFVREEGLEPPRLAALEPKSSASANSATRASDLRSRGGPATRVYERPAHYWSALTWRAGLEKGAHVGATRRANECKIPSSCQLLLADIASKFHTLPKSFTQILGKKIVCGLAGPLRHPRIVSDLLAGPAPPPAAGRGEVVSCRAAG